MHARTLVARVRADCGLQSNDWDLVVLARGVMSSVKGGSYKGQAVVRWYDWDLAVLLLGIVVFCPGWV